MSISIDVPDQLDALKAAIAATPPSEDAVGILRLALEKMLKALAI